MTDITDNKAAARYELQVDGETAFAAYELRGEVITFTHTIVPPALEGRGVGSRLIAGALSDVRARGLKVIPQCAFVATYIERHPEARDLLATR